MFVIAIHFSFNDFFDHLLRFIRFFKLFSIDRLLALEVFVSEPERVECSGVNDSTKTSEVLAQPYRNCWAEEST